MFMEFGLLYSNISTTEDYAEIFENPTYIKNIKLNFKIE